MQEWKLWKESSISGRYSSKEETLKVSPNDEYTRLLNAYSNINYKTQDYNAHTLTKQLPFDLVHKG